MYSIPTEFIDFIDLNCNRKEFIQSFLQKNGIESPIISINGKNHIYVNFSKKQYNPRYKIKTVIAHYDRAPFSYGANDNSVAVFCLMNWAVELSKSNVAHNVRLIFTDGEESESGIKNQGSYDLAKLFRKLKITKDDIFVFDCMGKGEIPVISKFNFSSKVPFRFIKKYNDLEKKAEFILQKSCNQFVKLPTHFSDNAGFLANGIPCVAISMLPSFEVVKYVQLINQTKTENVEKLHFCDDFPQTWKNIHSTLDTVENLDAYSFEITFNILNVLKMTNF